MTPRRSFFSFFSLSLLLAVCCTFCTNFGIFPICPISHFFPLPSSLNLFANNKRDKKNGTRLILVDFSSVVFPLFWMIRFRLRSHSSARGFCTGRVSRKSGRFRKNFFRAVDLEGETPLCVCVFEQMCGPCRCQYQVSSARCEGAINPRTRFSYHSRVCSRELQSSMPLMPSLGETLTHFTRAFSEKDGFEQHTGLSKDAKFLYEKRRILTRR